MSPGVVLLTISLLLLPFITSANYEDSIDNNEFAEFEEFDSEDVVPKSSEPQTEYRDSRDEEVFIINEENRALNEDESEFEHFHDVEEFEGFETREDKPLTEPKITITKVPIHIRASWDSYWLEILMIAGLIVYFINFITGRSKNSRIANTWFQTHKTLLEENFCLVGDDGSKERTSESIGFTKESENIFTLWCSGRTCCEGMLVELKLIKRQDLVAIISNMMKPTLDQIHIKVIMNKEDMDPFVFCVASKKTAQHMSKEIADINVYCSERRPGEKYNIPKNYSIMSEIPEVTSAILDSKIVTVLNKFSDNVDYIHLSDQYSGPKQPEDVNALKLPETQKVLLFGFNVTLKNKSVDEAINHLSPLMVMVFYLMEKIKKYKLSKEGKTKADKNRQRVEEAFLKSTHHSRTEAAAARKEQKRQLEKQKIMAEGDPDRQRRWEEKDQKRQAKKRAPKMKQLKVKAL